MEQNVFDVLKERGFIEQTTHEAEIRELLGKEPKTMANDCTDIDIVLRQISESFWAKKR